MSQQVNDNYPGKAPVMTDQQLKEIATAKYETKTDSQSEEVQSYDFPTEIVELPSKGKLYPKGHPLSKGSIEMKYMTAREEDILTNQSFIRQGVVLDKLFKSLIVTPIDYNDLLLCDKNAIMVAARVLGYGKDYPIKITSPISGQEIEHTIDLTKLEEKQIDWSLITEGVNEFELELPASKHVVKLKMLSHKDQAKMDTELKGLAKLKKNASVSTMMKYVITAIDGDSDNVKIRKFVDNQLLAIDSRAIRNYIAKVTPEIDLSIEIPDPEAGETFRSPINIGLDFFWPDSNL